MRPNHGIEGSSGNGSAGMPRELGVPADRTCPSRRKVRTDEVIVKKYVLVYESAADVLVTARLHFPAHRARWDEFRAQKTLLMIGPFADPRDGAMAIFTSREAAEEFARDDPFVLNGVVTAWSVREWNEAIVDA